MKRGWLAGMLALFAAGGARGIEPGAPAPDFSAQATGGQTVTLAGLRGGWVVLFFYPRAFTPGCTAQACSLRDGYAEIQALGATILGASLDSLERQERFKAEHRLPFDLIADADGEVARRFGVLGLGGRMARRVTFLIDPEGRVAEVIGRVRTGNHEAQVREALAALQEAREAE